MKLLTNLIFEPKGKHNSSLAYNIKDTVMSADGSKVYFALQDVPAGTALSNTDYWMLQIDLSGTKSAVENALASFGNYAKDVGTRVKGETAKVSGNPATCLPDAGSLLQPVTVLEPKQEGSGDPYPVGGKKNFLYLAKPLSYSIQSFEFDVHTGTISFAKESNSGAGNQMYFELDIDASKLVGKKVTLSYGSYSITSPGDSQRFYLMDQNGTTIAYMALNSDSYTSRTAVVPDGTTKFRILIRIDQTSTLPVGTKLTVSGLQLEVSDAFTGFEPAANIRPISGWDSANLTAAGINIAPRYVNPSRTGLTVVQAEDGSLTITGASATNGRINTPNFILPPGTYSLWPNNTAYMSGCSCYMRTPDGKQKGSVNLETTTSARGTFTLTEPTELCVSIYFTAGVEVNSTIAPMVKLGTDAADFEPYQGKFHTVQISRTVYGGKIDWLAGEIVANKGRKILTGAETYSTVSSGGVITPLTDAATPVAGGVEAWCSHYKRTTATSASNIANGEFAVSHKSISGNPRLFIRDDVNGANATALRDYIAAQYAAGTPVEVSYELAEPIRIPITPVIISAADPEQTNTLYGDGSIEVEYVKPLHVSIEERVAATVAAAMQQ